MTDSSIGGYELVGFDKINLIVGKNGSGKSTFLRAIDNATRSAGNVRYITPERGGVLTRDGNVETNMANQQWFTNVRAKNRFEQFRQTSAAEFRRLETLVLRQIEKDTKKRSDPKYTFDTTVDQINSLLDNVEVHRSPDGGFSVRNKGGVESRDNETLSSGEAELISLAIEILAFAFSCEDPEYTDKSNFLLFDEPDVHLHPDLQQRLMSLLVEATKGRAFFTFIATHSTAVVSSLSRTENVRIAFMGTQAKKLTFEEMDASLRAVMPIFGAHPLSNVFNERPILLVEGEDDERIWQQAVRSSSGAVNVWPCAAGDVQSLSEYEARAQTIITAVYEKAVAYSLRDRDDGDYEISDTPPVVRMRLWCRAAENLLLSDDVLSSLETNWEQLLVGLEDWLGRNEGHPRHADMLAFKASGWNRQQHPLKSLRNIILAVVGTSKPWEVAVGQTIATIKAKPAIQGDNGITAYLGPKLVAELALHT